MFRRIWAVIQKEFIQTLRDRRTLALQLSLPVILLLLFGYAITMNITHVPTIVADQSLDSASRSFVDALTASNYFDVVATTDGQMGVSQAIDTGEAQVGVIIPPDFAAHVAKGDARALVFVDGSDVFTAQAAYNAATMVAQMHSTQMVVDRLERSGLVNDGDSLLPLDTRMRILYNPDLKDLWFLIPGIISLLLQLQAVTLTASAVVREHEAGTIEQLLVTPIRPAELLIGKMIPNLVIAIVNMLTVLGLSVFWFGVPFRGNVGLFMALSLLYVFAGLGLGLLVSTVARNQRQVQQLSGMIIIMSLMLSGFVFPRESMPKVIQWVGALFPLTHFLPIARGVIIKGISADLLRGQVLSLGIYVVVIMVLAVSAFRQRLD